MNTKTKIRTEYAACGRHPGCNWELISVPYFPTAEAAQNRIIDHIEAVRRTPGLFTEYAEYKVMKRTITTIIEEWSDV